jgi:hypothetical protein
VLQEALNGEKFLLAWEMISSSKEKETMNPANRANLLRTRQRTLEEISVI